MEQYLSDQNQLQIFDNDNFSISCKNADLSAVDNFFDNIAHPYLGPMRDPLESLSFWEIQPDQEAVPAPYNLKPNK